MKTTKIALLALLGIVSTSALNFEDAQKTDIARGKFGALEITDYLEEGMKKTVHWPSKPYHRDYVQQTAHLQEAIVQIKDN